jgi:hypothetical protein
VKLTLEEFFEEIKKYGLNETLVVELHTRRAGHKVFVKYNDILTPSRVSGVFNWDWHYDWGSDPKVEEIYVTNYIPLSKLDLHLKESYVIMMDKLKDTLKSNSKLSGKNEKLSLVVKNLEKENKSLKKLINEMNDEVEFL